MHFSTKRIITWLLGMAMLLMVTLLAGTLYQLNAFSDFAEKVSHTRRVINRIVRIDGHHDAMMAEQRSFLLTGNTNFFRAYRHEADSSRRVLEELAGLVAGNTGQAANATRLRKLLNERIAQLAAEAITDTLSGITKPSRERLIERHDSTRKAFKQCIQTMYEVEADLLEVSLKGKSDGRRLTPFFVSALFLAGFGFIILAIVRLVKEVMKHKETQQALSVQLEKVKVVNQELEQFAFIATHDLQEPLRKLTTFTTKLSAKYGQVLPPDGQDTLNRIESSAARIAALIKDITNYTQLLDKQDSEPTLTSLDELITRVVDSRKEDIEKQKASVHLGLLPSVLCYPRQVTMLFEHLLDNALKFAYPGRQLQIGITHKPLVEPGSHGLQTVNVITVEDNGRGFSNDYQDKIFQVFGRLDKTLPGTGIGLAICKRVMDNHGGHIRAEGVEHTGASFILTFRPIKTHIDV